MAKSATFSKKSLMEMLRNSPAISVLSNAQRDYVNKVLGVANKGSLIRLYSILKGEKKSMEVLEADFNKKASKAFDQFAAKVRTEAKRLKRVRGAKAEKKEAERERKMQAALLKKLK